MQPSETTVNMGIRMTPGLIYQFTATKNVNPSPLCSRPLPALSPGAWLNPDTSSSVSACSQPSSHLAGPLLTAEPAQSLGHSMKQPQTPLAF